MIELPESHVLASQLVFLVQGKVVNRVEVQASPHKFAFFRGDAASYPAMLSGLRLDDAEAVGGMVVLKFGSMRLSFSDGVNLRLVRRGVRPPVRHQLLLGFDDGDCLVCTVRMYGTLWAFVEGTNDHPYYRAAAEKPSPLSAAFDREYFDSLREGLPCSLSAKAFLATEQRIPGLGNGVLQDVLFRARIHPRSRLSALSSDQWDVLYGSVKEMLWEMTARGGRDTESMLLGEAGGYRTLLSKKTYDLPCPACGRQIVRQAFLGGNVYFCPACQPLTG